MAEKVKFVVLDEPKKTPVIIATRAKATGVKESVFKKREARERMRRQVLEKGTTTWHPGV